MIEIVGMDPGALFADRFEIERTAGEGGMGVVYRARDLRAGGAVALKLLSERGDEGGLRFAREARALAEIEHPGIVRFVDHGRTADGVAWLAMEWLEGEELGARLQRRRLTAGEAAALGRRVAEALAAAHARGVVHRDVKPSNLFLVGGEIERVKVIDFGIARGAADRRATMTGTTIGTPAYMAPEQARGARDLDGRTDIFSLGCVLFECVAGRPPFEGQHAMAILAKLLLEEAPPLRTLAPATPRALEELIARMLAKDPARRPGSGLEVAAALDALGRGDSAPSSSTGTRRAAVALTGSEQRLVSVIVASTHAQATPDAVPDADTVPVTGAHEDLGTVRRALAPFDARVEPLADGSLVVALAGSGGATDQSARAARCALALRDAMGEGSLALATGRGVLDGGVPIGEAIDRAVSLLRAWQEIGVEGRARVVVDPVAAGLLDSRFVVETRGSLLELAEERDVLVDVARTIFGKPTPCVGRDRDIAAIEAALAECIDDGASRAVLVTGLAGIGKSRVAQEALRRARDRGDVAAIWVARCDSMGSGSPRRLLADLASRAVGLGPGDGPAERQEKLRAFAASRLDPEAAIRVAEFLGELVGAPFPDEVSSVQLRAARQDARLHGDQIRRALEDLLEAECARGPLLVVVEDLHWADPPSVAFVDAALGRLAERAFMVLGLARPEVRERFPRLWSGRGALQLTLGELSRKASERIVRHALGEGVAPAVVARVVEQAAGHPFYLEELIRAAAEGQGDAPGTVLAMVQARLETLSPEARRALRAGSIFGEAFWSGAVRALLGGNALEDGEVELVELEERELVRSRESRFPAERELCFRHALVREAAYGMLTPADRATGHRLAGAWLEQAGERDAGILAEHFERGEDPERAALWYQRSAEQALEANELEAVVWRARRAAALGAVGETLGAALVCQGEAHLWRGETAEARAPLAEAMRLLPHGGAAWFRAASAQAWVATTGADQGLMRTVASEIRQALGPSPSGPALVAAARIACNLLLLGLRAEAKPFGEALAPVLAGPAGDPMVAPHAHELAAMGAHVDGDFGASSASFAAAAACFDALGNTRQAVLNRTNVAVALMELGRLAEAETELRAVTAAAERLGLPTVVASAGQNLGVVLLRKGELPEARAALERSAEAFAAAGDRRMEAATRTYLASALRAAGDLDRALTEASRAVAIGVSVPPIQCFALAGLAQILLARDVAGGALSAAEEAMRILDELGDIDEGDAFVRLTYAEALDAAGEHGRASAAIAAARDHLLARAARIVDAAWRRSFLEDVAENARTLALAAEPRTVVDQGSTM